MTVYVKTNWTDRIVAKPLTFQLINNGDGTTTLSPAEGAVTQAGTAINATVMNNLEKQYDFAMDEVSKNYLPLVGGTLQGSLTLTGSLTGAIVNATTALQEAGVTLSSKYLGLVGGTVTGALTVNGILQSANSLRADITTAGQTTLILKNSADDSYIRVFTTAGNNYIASSNYASTASKNLIIAGYSGNAMGTFTVISNASIFQGTVQGTTINATTALQEAGVGLASKYFKLDGTNNVTGIMNLVRDTPSLVVQDTNATYPNTYAITGYQNKFSFRVGANSTANEIMNLQSTGMVVNGTITIGGGNFFKIADVNGNTVNLVSIQVGDSTGIGVALSSGGKMVIGGGESATTVMNDVSTGTGNQEMMYVTSDNDIMLWSNVQSGVANKNEFKFDKNGVQTINGVTVASDVQGTSIWTGSSLLTADITGLKDITTCPNGWQLEFRNVSGTAYISYAYIHKSCSKGSALLMECGNTQNANYNKKTTGVASNNTTLTSSASNGTGDPASRNLSNIRVW